MDGLIVIHQVRYGQVIHGGGRLFGGEAGVKVKKTTMSKTYSICCKAPWIVASSRSGITNWYVCCSCGQACDVDLKDNVSKIK